jgi:tripeptidyl-peptidase-1
VAALVGMVSAEAYSLHPTKAAQAPWQLSKFQPAVNMQEMVQMNIGLTRKNTAVLEKILLEVSDPKSASYGEHLTDEQLRGLVGSSPDSVEAVKSWLARHGIRQVEVATHMDALKFKATRAQVSALLDVQWAHYDNTVSQQASVRALGATQVPDHLTSIIEMVAGHRGWPIPVAPKAARKATETNPDINVTPELLYRVYDETEIPTTPAGKLNKQSFFQAGGQAVEASDLTQFCSTYLSHGFNGSCTIEKYVGGSDQSTPGVESSLDSQYITALSYGADTWAYTYNNNDLCSDLLSWSQDVFSEGNSVHPNVISMSYGSQHLPTYCEGTGAERLNVDTMKMGAAGISVLIASGDSGSAEFARAGWNAGYLAASFPAELPYVTSVGSTTFESGNSGTQRAAIFSGGGFSYNWAAPAYQAAATHAFLTTSTHLPKDKYNATGRGTPDVSFLGEGFNVINAGSLYEPLVGGTSCSTPSFAGMVTLLNNVRLQQGKTLGFLNPLLYSNTQGFTDIVSGNNDMHSDGNGWYAQAGWDAATGLGTPIFSKLVAIVKALNNGATPAPAAPVTPAPPVPATPAPPATPMPVATPAPSSSSATFTQKVCTSSTCTGSCQSHTLPQNQCLSINGGGSAKAACSSNGLTMTEFPLSSDCSGFSIPTTQPINKCVQDNQGSYLENICSNQQQATTTAAAVFRKV